MYRTPHTYELTRIQVFTFKNMILTKVKNVKSTLSLTEAQYMKTKWNQQIRKIAIVLYMGKDGAGHRCNLLGAFGTRSNWRDLMLTKNGLSDITEFCTGIPNRSTRGEGQMLADGRAESEREIVKITLSEQSNDRCEPARLQDQLTLTTTLHCKTPCRAQIEDEGTHLRAQSYKVPHACNLVCSSWLKWKLDVRKQICG